MSALCLFVCVRGYGGHIDYWSVVLVNAVVGTVASLIPIPGGHARLGDRALHRSGRLRAPGDDRCRRSDHATAGRDLSPSASRVVRDERHAPTPAPVTPTPDPPGSPGSQCATSGKRTLRPASARVRGRRGERSANADLHRPARPHSSGSARWSAPGSSRCSAPRARWPGAAVWISFLIAGRRSPGSRATPSRSSAPVTRRPAASLEYVVRGFGDGHRRRDRRAGCSSPPTPSSPAWSRCRSAATRAVRSPTVSTAWIKVFAVVAGASR